MSDERCSAETNERLREALELAKNIIFGGKHLADRERNYAKSAEYQSYLDTLEVALASPQPADKRAWRIEHDGFEGVEIGSYTTLEGKEGVVLQQIGSRIVHVYGRKWLKSFPADSAPACVHKSCDDPEWCAGEPQCRYGAGSAQTERMTKALELADECEREVGYSSSRMCSVAKTIRSLVNQPQPAQAPAVTEFCATCGELWVDGTPCNQPEPNCQVTSMGPVKLTYIKRWRTIVPLPAKYADEIVEALRTPPQPAQAPVVTEEMIEVAARELWNDRDAQYGGSWDSRDSEEVCVIQTKATARAMLIAALALPQPVREELVARAMYDWQYGTGAWRYSESKSRDHFIGLARAALAMFGQPQTPAVTKEGGK